MIFEKSMNLVQILGKTAKMRSSANQSVELLIIPIIGILLDAHLNIHDEE